jgi:hypothetical protein
MVLACGLQQLRGDRRRFGNRFAFHRRDGLRAVRLIISDPPEQGEKWDGTEAAYR